MSAVILLTGASRGIGLEIAKELAIGNRIVALSRTITPELKKLESPTLLLVQGDVTDDIAVDKVISTALEKWGKIDSLVLNAGTLDPLGKTSSFSTPAAMAAYKELFNVNYFSLISIIAKSLPHLVKNSPVDGLAGRIILVSSGAATKGVQGWGCYSSSKAAMNSLARTLGSEEGSIMTIAVRPGVVDTAMQTAIRETGAESMSSTDHANFSGLLAAGKLLDPALPAKILADLALKGRKELSGSFVSWDDEGLV